MIENTIDLQKIDALLAQLADDVIRTPTVELPAFRDEQSHAPVWAKMELWQVTGSFKARGALANVYALDDAARQRGVTAVSAGNHAIATAFAANKCGIDAKVVMLSKANPLRVELCKAYGAEVEFADTVHAAFERAHEIVANEGRSLIHPFEGVTTALGTAGVGRELALDVPDLDAVIVPIGGGGLCAGVAAAIKLSQPNCKVYGVEPFGADSMHRSRQAGKPQSLESVTTIADSLGAPMALPITFALCEQYVDDLVRVSDDELISAMQFLSSRYALTVEPACAAATAALRGPLKDRLAGKSVGLIFCGSNIDIKTWQSLTAEATA